MMATGSTDVIGPEERDEKDSPEAAALLTPQPPTSDGTPNTEPGAASSSPLLVHADPEIDRKKRGEKSKRRKSRKDSALRTRIKKPDAKEKNRQSTGRREDSDDEKPGHRSHQEDHGIHRAPQQSSSLWRLVRSCICVRGTMRSLASATELPHLSAKAETKLKSLDKHTRKSHVEVFVRHTDNMPFSNSSITNYGHPMAVIHLVDVCTGLPVVAHQHTGPAKFAANMLNAFEWNTSLVWGGIVLQDILSPQVVVLIEIVEPRRRRTNNRAPTLMSNAEEKNRSANSPDRAKELDYDLSSEAFYRRIAWCFFKPISEQGNIRLPTLAVSSITSPSGPTLRLQFFAWTPISWLDAQQARSQFQWNPDSGDGVPTVFLQYQRRVRTRLASTLHVEIWPVASTKHSKRLDGVAEATSEAAMTEQSAVTSIEGNQNETIEETKSHLNPEQAPSTTPVSDPLLSCKRHPSEACVVPQRVLHRLPTGRKGCSCLAFSPDGLFLAAAVHHLTSTAEEWAIHIYEINTGSLWQSCRGHQSLIYTVAWGLLADGKTKALVSASSDGAAIQWDLRIALMDRMNTPAVLPSQSFQHMPAPVFVYCAIFHPTQPHLIVTGASDGRVRLWAVQRSVTTSGRPYASAPVYDWRIHSENQSVAIHSIQIEAKRAGRLFCGDASGTITVWMPATTASGQVTYELSKTVQTGQHCVASMALHPRKQHLLVLTHPHALFQYETRSFLLLHKKYAGIECDQLLTKASFSPDGQYVVSGSEDGVPHLFRAVEGVRVDGLGGGLWGHRFVHEFPVMEVAWSPTAHVVAIGAYGETHPIVVLCAKREDRLLNKSSSPQELPDRWRSGSERFAKSGQASLTKPLPTDRSEHSAQRRHQRLEEKLAREIVATQTQSSPRAS